MFFVLQVIPPKINIQDVLELDPIRPNRKIIFMNSGSYEGRQTRMEDDLNKLAEIVFIKMLVSL